MSVQSFKESETMQETSRSVKSSGGRSLMQESARRGIFSTRSQQNGQGVLPNNLLTARAMEVLTFTSWILIMIL